MCELEKGFASITAFLHGFLNILVKMQALFYLV